MATAVFNPYNFQNKQIPGIEVSHPMTLLPYAPVNS